MVPWLAFSHLPVVVSTALVSPQVFPTRLLTLCTSPSWVRTLDTTLGSAGPDLVLPPQVPSLLFVCRVSPEVSEHTRHPSPRSSTSPSLPPLTRSLLLVPDPPG